MTTISCRDNILAADQCLTWYEGKQNEATARTYAKKIRLIELGPYRRLAIASRGDTVDGVLIERLIATKMAHAVMEEEEGQDIFGEPQFNDWGVDTKGIDWNDEEEYFGGIILYRDLRSEKKIHFWQIEDARVISRIVPGTFVAVGCDAPLAYAAMEAGADAIKSVWIAGKYGSATGGPVNYVNAATMLLNTQRVNPLEKP